MAKQQTKSAWLNDQIRKYRQRNAVLETIISAGPPIKTTSIGRTQWDPRTCTCGVKGRTDKDHDPDCAVEPVVDSAPLIAATRELRLNDAEIASLLSLKEEQLGPADTSQWDAILEQYEHMREEVARVNKENDHLRVQLASVTGEVMTSNAISFADSDLAQLPPAGSESHANGTYAHRGY